MFLSVITIGVNIVCNLLLTGNMTEALVVLQNENKILLGSLWH